MRVILSLIESSYRREWVGGKGAATVILEGVAEGKRVSSLRQVEWPTSSPFNASELPCGSRDMLRHQVIGTDMGAHFDQEKNQLIK